VLGWRELDPWELELELATAGEERSSKGHWTHHAGRDPPAQGVARLGQRAGDPQLLKYEVDQQQPCRQGQ
jgi:hypothetical protein